MSVDVDTLARRAAAAVHAELADLDPEPVLAAITGRRRPAPRRARRRRAALAAAVVLAFGVGAAAVTAVTSGQDGTRQSVQVGAEGREGGAATPTTADPDATTTIAPTTLAPLVPPVRTVGSTGDGPRWSVDLPAELRDGSTIVVEITGLDPTAEVELLECPTSTVSSGQLATDVCLGLGSESLAVGSDRTIRASVPAYRWFDPGQAPPDGTMVDCRAVPCALAAVQWIPDAAEPAMSRGEPVPTSVALAFAPGDPAPTRPAVRLEPVTGAGPVRPGDRARFVGVGFRAGEWVEADLEGARGPGSSYATPEPFFPPQDPTGQNLIVADRAGRFAFDVVIPQGVGHAAKTTPTQAPHAGSTPAIWFDCRAPDTTCTVRLVSHGASGTGSRPMPLQPLPIVLPH